ncbi:HECT-domain ubiquitin-transferase domain containing protein [Theileria equi strain WA]|uniref:HECT-type E3 ubiquitin transferase n=1 Tax=Theileria equi strain WA TaxID=1537102 RepID=L0AYA1_THEEQ|nr:HECT-domain ubiquitin-transferase domain containing protein [Theileria equi strain WA]AFZ80540.1 HECT-domain ubiquitin-transferase domain containing protein [Theileria equi strain WA]|eukprot:XP_004830206.1 HECT-domain ubiquitin-transferase domain containing protein [Theileria equi strain WA]
MVESNDSGLSNNFDQIPLRMAGGIRGGKWIALISMLQSGSDSEQMIALTELSHALSYSDEDYLLGFPALSYIKVLMHILEFPHVKYSKHHTKDEDIAQKSDETAKIQLPYYELLSVYSKTFDDSTQCSKPAGIDDAVRSSLSSEDAQETKIQYMEEDDDSSEFLDPELMANKMITAASCINTILDVLPYATRYFRTHKVSLNVLVDKLNDIQYIDLAERVLLIVEKLSREIPVYLVKSGTMVAMLQYIDFFPLSIQVSSLSSVLNLARSVEKVGTFKKHVLPIFPSISTLLSNTEKKILHTVSSIWKEIVTAAVKLWMEDKEFMEQCISSITIHGVLEKFFQLIVTPNRISKIKVAECICTISKMAGSSIELTDRIFKLDILNHFSASLVTCSRGYLTVHGIVNLLISLLDSNDSDNLYQKRLEYYKENKENYNKLINIFPPDHLFDVYDLVLSQQLKDRIFFLIYKIMDIGSSIDSLSGVLTTLLPVSRLVELISFTLIGSSNSEDQLFVSINIITLLLKVFKQDVVVTLDRYGIFERLESIKVERFADEIKHICSFSGRTTEKNIIKVSNSDDILSDIRKNAGVWTVHELNQRVSMDIFTGIFHDVDNMTAFVKSIVQNAYSSTHLYYLWDAWVKLFEWNNNFAYATIDKVLSNDADPSWLIGGDPEIMNAMDLFYTLRGEKPPGKSVSSDEDKIDFGNIQTSKSGQHKSDSGESDVHDSMNPKLYGKRIKYAIDTLQRYMRKDILFFPFSQVIMDVKFRLKCSRHAENFKISTLSVFIPCTSAVNQLETLILTHVHNKTNEAQGNSVVPRKRAKYTFNPPSDLDHLDYYRVEIYINDILLPSKMSVYEALCRFTDRCNSEGAPKAYLERCYSLYYKLYKRTDLQCLEAYFNKKATPILTTVPAEVFSPVALYLDMLSYVVHCSPCTNLEHHISALRGTCSKLPLENVNELQRMALQRVLTDSQTHCPKICLQGLEQRSEFSGLIQVNTNHLLETVIMNMKRLDCVFNNKGSYKDLLLEAGYIFQGSKVDIDEEILLLLKMMSVLSTVYDALVYHESQPFDAIKNLDTHLSISKRMTLMLYSHLSSVDKSLSYRMPNWVYKIALTCPMIFSLESRRILFDLCSMDPNRILRQYSSRIKPLIDEMETKQDSTDTFDEYLREYLSNFRFGKTNVFNEVEDFVSLQKLKIKVNRDSILRDATYFLNKLENTRYMYDTTPKLEVEYKNEVGIGSGPTQEFYSLFIDGFISCQAPSLLECYNGFFFPSPHKCEYENLRTLPFLVNEVPREELDFSSMNTEAILFTYFKILGKMCAFSLLDGKIFDLTLHPLFWYYCQFPYSPRLYSIEALSHLDPELAKSLSRAQMSNIDDLYLTFSYQGYDLVENGGNIAVTRDNFADYVAQISKFKLDDGIRLQIWAFRYGYSMVLPLYTLWMYNHRELSLNVFGNYNTQQEFWKEEHLRSFILPDHGYDTDSKVYNNMINLMTEFSPEEQRSFLKFCTGAPILPRGGFAGLVPNMKIVKKGNDTRDLPSVMTCTNYLKLPDYKTVDELKFKLSQAISEGQNAFNLS